MRNTFAAAIISVILSAPAFAGTGLETAKGGADTLMVKLQNADSAGIQSAGLSGTQLPKPFAQREKPGPELIKSLMIDLIEVQAQDAEDASKKFTETRQNLEDGGFTYVIGAIDSGFRVKIAYVVTKYVPVDLPIMQTFQLLTNESKAVIDRKLTEAKTNMAKAGLSYIAAEVIQDPKYVEGWYDINITYARK